jgi:hypothetical protein
VQADLFDQLIPTVLATRPASRRPDDTFRPRRTWNPHDVRRWLTYLAQHLCHHTDPRSLHWWHVARHTLTPRVVRLAVGLVLGPALSLLVGLTFGLAVGRGGLAGGLVFGLTFGPMFGLLFGPTAGRWLADEPAYANLQVRQRVTLLTRSLGTGLAVGLAVGLTAGLVLGLAVGLAVGLATGLTVGLTAGTAGGVTAGLMVGLITWTGIPNNRTGWASRPQSTYRATRTLTVLQLCLALLGIGLVVVLVGWLAAGLPVTLTTGLMVGLVGGLMSGLVIGLAARVRDRLVIRSGAWLSYVLAICRLAASGKLPLRLMGFLDDAYRLGLLRIVGPAYQFRHAEFQDHLVRTADTRTD